MAKKTKKYKLKEKLISYLNTTKSPISVKEIQQKLDSEYNKTSIYRQLGNLFESKQVHKIETGKETLFEIANQNHAHFQCIKCSLVECLSLPEKINLQLEKLDNFKVLDTEISLKGVCSKCLSES